MPLFVPGLGDKEFAKGLGRLEPLPRSQAGVLTVDGPRCVLFTGCLRVLHAGPYAVYE